MLSKFETAVASMVATIFFGIAIFLAVITINQKAEMAECIEKYGVEECSHQHHDHGHDDHEERPNFAPHLDIGDHDNHEGHNH